MCKPANLSSDLLNPYKSKSSDAHIHSSSTLVGGGVRRISRNSDLLTWHSNERKPTPVILWPPWMWQGTHVCTYQHSHTWTHTQRIKYNLYPPKAEWKFSIVKHAQLKKNIGYIKLSISKRKPHQLKLPKEDHFCHVFDNAELLRTGHAATISCPNKGYWVSFILLLIA